MLSVDRFLTHHRSIRRAQRTRHTPPNFSAETRKPNSQGTLPTPLTRRHLLLSETCKLAFQNHRPFNRRPAFSRRDGQHSPDSPDVNGFHQKKISFFARPLGNALKNWAPRGMTRKVLRCAQTVGSLPRCRIRSSVCASRVLKFGRLARMPANRPLTSPRGKSV